MYTGAASPTLASALVETLPSSAVSTVVSTLCVR